MAAPNNILSRLLEPVTECLTPEAARRLVELRADAATQQRVDELADKNTEGLLTEEEKAEYEAYVSASTFIAILQAKARANLARHPAI
jgi:hypothetical protein